MARISSSQGMIDITSPTSIEIDMSIDGTVLWINIDGACRLRACLIKPGSITLDSVTRKHLTGKKRKS